jgi:glycosyltransferase involved in cell wall biosynthesis
VANRSVIHVVSSTQRRGAEMFAADLAVELERRELATDVLALTAGGDGAPLPFPVLGRRAFDPSTLRALRRASDGARVVVAHGSRTLPACALALAGSGVPFVYRSIGDPAAWSATAARRARTALLLRRARLVTVLWRGAADVLTRGRAVPADRIRVVPNGVAAARCPVPDASDRLVARERFGLATEAPVLGYVGSLTGEKQVDVVIAAVARIPGAVLLVAGSGPQRAALEVLATREAPSRVRFVGTLVDPAPVYAAADAVILASRTEGMPGVLIEAGLSGRPAVAFGVGAVAEVVTDGETGVVVPPGDVRALTVGARRVLGDAAAMGAAARRRCLARFEIGVIGADWAGVLAEVMG